MKIKIKGIAVAAFIYMYSAMAVFFAGWLRPAFVLFWELVLFLECGRGAMKWKTRYFYQKERCV